MLPLQEGYLNWGKNQLTETNRHLETPCFIFSQQRMQSCLLDFVFVFKSNVVLLRTFKETADRFYVQYTRSAVQSNRQLSLHIAVASCLKHQQKSQSIRSTLDARVFLAFKRFDHLRSSMLLAAMLAKKFSLE